MRTLDTQGGTGEPTVPVPAGRVLTVTASPHPETVRPGFGLNILQSCTGADRCLTRQLSYATSRSASWRNDGPDEREVIVALMGLDRVNVRFEVTGTTANTTCAAAMPVSDGTRLTDQGAGGTSTRGLCSGRDPLFYSATIPAGETLTVTATSASGTYWNRTIDLASSCSGTTCLATGSSSSNGATTLTYTNTSGASMPVVFSVSRRASDTGTGLFDLNVSID